MTISGGGQWQRTNNERNHGSSISTSGFKTLDQLLDLPDLDILLSFVRRRGAHLGEATVDQGRELSEALRTPEDSVSNGGRKSANKDLDLPILHLRSVSRFKKMCKK